MPKVNFRDDLLKAVKLKAKAGEAPEAFAERVVRAATADSFTDDEWAALSADAQTWVNEGVDAIQNRKPVKALPEPEPTPEKEKDMAKKTTPAAAAPAAPAKRAVTAAAPAAAPATAEAPAKRGRKAVMPKPAKTKLAKKSAVSAMTTLRKLVLAHPNWPVERVHTKLIEDHPDISVSTVQTTRSGVRATMALVPELAVRLAA